MFILTKIADLVEITPEDFARSGSHAQAIQDNINAKYANKIIQKIGLCICFYDMDSASDGLIGHGSGLVNVNVEFRMIVFRPFKSEIIMGKISNAVEDGISIRTQFFDDIFVPSDMLPKGTFFNHNEQVHVWQNGDEEMYFDKHETVRFRIEGERWHDQTPTAPPDPEHLAEPVKKTSPYSIIGSMMEDGLGPCLWWDGDPEQGQEEDEAME